MKLSTLVLIVMVLSVSIASAQPPDTLWTADFGSSFHERAYSVVQTDDGNFMAAGYRVMSYYDSESIWLLKVTDDGDTLWTKTYNFGEQDWAKCIQQTDDGGFIITGGTESFGTQYDGDVFLMKTDADGDSAWFHVWVADSPDEANEVQQTSDGGYVIVGTTQSFGNNSYNIWLLKTDANGDTLWTKTYGATGQGYIDGNSVQQTADGGYIIAGSSQFVGSNYEQAWLIKTDADGNVEWSQDYGDGDSDTEEALSVRQTTDGGYIFTGRKRPMGDDSNFWLVKTDADGVVEWTYLYSSDREDWGYCVRQTSDGGYIAAGKGNSYGMANVHCFAIKTDAAGDTMWTFTYGGNGEDIAFCVEETSDHGYIMAGKTESYAYEDLYLIRLAGDPSYVAPGTPALPGSARLYPVYPNPFNPAAVISFEVQVASEVELAVYDIAGHNVALLVNGWRYAGLHEATFDGAGLASGIYFVRMTAGDVRQVQKVLLMK